MNSLFTLVFAISFNSNLAWCGKCHPFVKHIQFFVPSARRSFHPVVTQYLPIGFSSSFQKLSGNLEGYSPHLNVAVKVLLAIDAYCSPRKANSNARNIQSILKIQWYDAFHAHFGNNYNSLIALFFTFFPSLLHSIIALLFGIRI